MQASNETQTNATPDHRPGQVQLATLLFGKSWEDPASDRAALRIQPGDRVVTITSGGCNTFELLLDDPGEIFAVDINPAQNYLVELKIAAILELTLQEYILFVGHKSGSLSSRSNALARIELYEMIKYRLGPAALNFWGSHQDFIQIGIDHSGRYERFLGTFRKVLSTLQGRRRLLQLFEQRTLLSQQEYFDREWNTRRWRALFKLAFNRRTLASRGLVADYFKFDDGSSSFAESFFKRTEHALKHLPVSTNYFLQQYLLGEYREGALPAYLMKDNYEIVKGRLDRIELVTADLKEWLSIQEAGSVACFSLSNICELMSEQETMRLFEEVGRTAVSGARICFRNLMVPREAPAASDRGTWRTVKDTKLSAQLRSRDRSFVYGKVDALTIVHDV